MHEIFLLFNAFQITKQIEVVNGVYKLHNLPEFYKVSGSMFLSPKHYVSVSQFYLWIWHHVLLFFQDARPHISLAWALGDIGHSLKKVVEEVSRRSVVDKSMENGAFTCKFNRIECKIGSKTYTICKLSDWHCPALELMVLPP